MVNAYKTSLLKHLLGFVVLMASSCLAYADTDTVATDSTSKLQVSGFVSLIGGKLINDTYPANYTGLTQMADVNCPCYIADWSNKGVYNSSASFKPESHAGVQLQYTISPQFNIVGQVVIRGEDTTPNVTWAYANYKFNENWELHLGRQRIPLYYYSPFQDVGFAYPWLSPPPELYGWDATNYNGASLRYTNSFGSNNLTASAFTGEEKISHSGYFALNYPGNTDVSWSSIVGADAEVNNGPLTLRAVYLQASTNATNLSDPNNLIYQPSKLKAYGLAANLDFDSWFILSEFTQLKRDYNLAQYTLTAPAATIGAGLRLGKWTPFLNYATYTEKSTNLAVYSPVTFKRTSLTLRYDIDSNSDVKAQWDRNLDTTANNGGNVSVIRVSYDRVF